MFQTIELIIITFSAVHRKIFRTFIGLKGIDVFNFSSEMKQNKNIIKPKTSNYIKIAQTETESINNTTIFERDESHLNKLNQKQKATINSRFKTMLKMFHKNMFDARECVSSMYINQHFV